ncbi:RluA family pseudouridine synthase [Reichenbachiella ulvae]|uniref:RluA family pseudouridine synthase n=1 Tax=Reichenbachiella ulvae TaxID=2980104 RepID=A0ABT3CRZ7_9BACT|nr:RluA family pseudouridine synthase [Reichenbachiella ulvae]MCV9386392.1 RluA family pseudouridine synthase [Reichenbachiella ulvae]
MQEYYELGKKEKPQFLNRLAPKVFEWVVSKAKAKKAIASGAILVNGKPVAYDAKVYPGDKISFNLNDGAVINRTSAKVFEQKIEVAYEDQHLAVLNKPGGLSVNGNQYKTLENTLPFNLQLSKEPDALDQMRPLHRLDGPTCGLVMVAKTERAQVLMGRQFQEKKIRKRYQAVIVGKLEPSKGTVDLPVDGKKSLSEYETVKTGKSLKYGDLSLVHLYPVTGRTHQLRIHMSEMGCPIVGDKFYSKGIEVLNGKGLMLCSDQLVFSHPISKKQITVQIDVPNKFNTYMKREDRRALD